MNASADYARWVRWAAVLLAIMLLHGLAVWGVGWGLRGGVTADEPLHVAGAHQIRHLKDYRVNREDPPLWQWPIGWVLKRDDLNSDFDAAAWNKTGGGVTSAVGWYREAVLGQGANGSAVEKARGVMVLWGMALVGLASWMTWRMNGGMAGGSLALIAGVFVAVWIGFDPLVLGHGAIVKNDVAISTAYLLMLATVAWWWEKRTWAALLCLGLMCGAAASIKFSGLVMGMFALGAVFVGSVVNEKRVSEARAVSLIKSSIRGGLKGTVRAGLGLLLMWAVIWGAYGFRFAPSADERVRFNMAGLVRYAAEMYGWQQAAYELQAGQITQDQYAARAEELKRQRGETGVALGRDGVTRSILELYENKGLPEAYLAGLMYTRASSLWRPAYMFGQVSDVGFTGYFFFAWLVKTPVGFVLLVVLAGVTGAYRLVRKVDGLQTGEWMLLAGAAWYGAWAMAGNLNIGLRHMLPVAAPVAVVCGGLLMRAVCLRSLHDVNREGGGCWKTRGAAWALLSLGVAEMGLSYPRCIEFYNVAGRMIGPVHLLGDSNLDWGQGLPALARWQKQNPQLRLKVLYFGVDEPGRYGIVYENVVGSWAGSMRGLSEGKAASELQDSDVLAVSASHLQGTYLREPLARMMREVRLTVKPREVIGGGMGGGTIYLFDVKDLSEEIRKEMVP